METLKNIELSNVIIEKIKTEVPDMIREFMEKDLVKMILSFFLTMNLREKRVGMVILRILIKRG